MTDDFDSLLPTSNSTDWELALEQASGERIADTDVDIIRRVRDPWICPPHLLNFLAFERSVDLWDDSWSDLKKREVIAQTPELHRLKGTAAGLRKAVKIVDAEIVKIIAPPADFFFGFDETEDQRRAFLSRYPQLRIYPQRNLGKTAGLMFDTGFFDVDFWLDDEAFFRAQPRVFLWDYGVETELTVLTRRQDLVVEQLEEWLQVSQPTPSMGLMVGSDVGFFDFGFWFDNTADERLYTLHTRKELTVPGTQVLAREVLTPGLKPIDIVSEKVFETGELDAAGFWGDLLFDAPTVMSFWFDDDAHERVYQRMYLFDPRRPVEAQGATAFWGVGQYGIEHHHAEVTVKLRVKRTHADFGIFGSDGAFWDAGFWIEQSEEELRAVLRALATHQRLSDRLLVSTDTISTAKVAVGLKIGSFKVGQLMEKI